MRSGDVVRLKSGGPDMTVSLKLGEDVNCVWFASGDTDVHRYTFEAEMLETVGKLINTP
jgi:uncharacterized protein YodC (DUF2158 family)